MNATRSLIRSTLGSLAALAVAASLTGCDNKSYTSPTAPPLRSFYTNAVYHLLVEPTNPANSYPRAGELLVDGQVVWAGEIGEPDPGPFSSWPYNIEKYIEGSLLSGQHTLSLRITDQRQSPTSYNISGGVVFDYGKAFGYVDGESWQVLNVSLATGNAWTVQFVVPAEP